MNKIKIALIPAAGVGSRWAPISNVVPKEMLPIKNYPIIYYIVNEAIANDIEKIYIVINKSKQCIINFFNNSIFPEITNMRKRIKFIYQKKQKGLGDAILKGEKYIKEPFLLMLPDIIVSLKDDSKLFKIYNKTNCPVIALAEENKVNLKNYGVIQKLSIQDDFIKIIHMIEKPNTKLINCSNYIILGRYILTPDIFKFIKKSINFTEALNLYNNINGVLYSNNLDTGTPEKYSHTISYLKGVKNEYKRDYQLI